MPVNNEQRVIDLCRELDACRVVATRQERLINQLRTQRLNAVNECLSYKKECIALRQQVERLENFW
jgi:hypothetical protein